MADYYDYNAPPGVFVPPPEPDSGGIYLLEEPRVRSTGQRPHEGAGLRGGSSRRGGDHLHAYDDCTRQLWADPRTHPRSTWAGQAYPGPMGAGRREGFHGGPEDDMYARGSVVHGRPGFRGLTSSREQRPAIDNIMWDPRPPHYNSSHPAHGNAQLHLEHPDNPGVPPVPGFKDSAAAASPAVPAAGVDWNRIERLVSGKDDSASTLEIIKVVLFVVIVVLLAMWVMVKSSEKALARELECALREALLEAKQAREKPAAVVAAVQ